MTLLEYECESFDPYTSMYSKYVRLCGNNTIINKQVVGEKEVIHHQEGFSPYKIILGMKLFSLYLSGKKQLTNSWRLFFR
jgi:hypothetical protein